MAWTSAPVGVLGCLASSSAFAAANPRHPPLFLSDLRGDAGLLSHPARRPASAARTTDHPRCVGLSPQAPVLSGEQGLATADCAVRGRQLASASPWGLRSLGKRHRVIISGESLSPLGVDLP